MDQNSVQLKKCIRIVPFSSSLTAQERLANLPPESLNALIAAIQTNHSHLPEWISPSLIKQAINGYTSIENSNNLKRISKIYMMRNSSIGIEFLLRYEEENFPFSYWILEKDLLTNESFSSSLEDFRKNPFDFNLFKETLGCSIYVISHRLVEGNILYLFEVKTINFIVYFWEPVRDMNENYAIRFYNYYLRCVPQKFIDTPTNFPKYKSDSLLKSQIEGVQWIIDRWLNKEQCILGDEVNFGKSIQFLSFLEYINENSDWHGPFIIIIDQPDDQHDDHLFKWKQEVEKWSNLYPIIYDGDQDSCLILRQFGFPAVDKDGNVQNNSLSFNILLISYKLYYRDKDKLQNYKWQIACFHNPTNNIHHQLQFSSSVIGLNETYKIILCDNLINFSRQKIINLLNFLRPSVSWTNSLSTELYQERTKQLLESIILCRTKHNITNEYAAFIMPTPIQKIMLRLINLNELSQLCHPKNKEKINHLQKNVLAQYVCNHPFLIEGAESYLTSKIIGDKKSRLIGVSAKFLALDRIISASLGKQIKIVLFAQSKQFNSLIEEFLKLSQAYYFVIDEQMEEKDIQNLLKYFNSQKNTDYFIILSSIKLNIIDISTVSIIIILDSEMEFQSPIINSEPIFNKMKIPKKFIFRLITFGTQEHEQFIQFSKEREFLNSIMVKSEKNADNEFFEILPPDQNSLIDPPSIFSSTDPYNSFNDIISEFRKVAQIVPASSLNSIEQAYIKSQSIKQTMSDREFLSFIIRESDQPRGPSTEIENEADDDNTNNSTFNESEFPDIIKSFKKYGFGSWDEISQKTIGHSPSQIFEFCAIVLIISLRSIQGSLIPNYPALLNQLYMTVPDFTDELLFCSESRLWSSAFCNTHSFNRTLQQIRKSRELIGREALSLLEILEMRCIYQIWSSNFGHDYFSFNKLPPVKDKVRDHSMFNKFRDKLEIELESPDSRIYDIVRLMKYDLIIEQKFEIHQYFNWWCESEFNEMMRVFKNYGFSFDDIREFHAKTGILSKSSQEVKRFAIGLKSSILEGKKIPQMHFAPDSVQKLPNFMEWSNLKEEDCLQARFADEIIRNINFTIQNLDNLYFEIPVNWTKKDMKKLLILILHVGVPKFDDIFIDPSYSLPSREVDGNIIPIFENLSSFALFISRNKDALANDNI